MAERYTLEAQPRTVVGKQVKALRRQDLVPAVIYGAGGQPINISCPRRALEIVLSKASGTHIIDVSVSGSAHNALVREVQRDKVKRSLIHVDFLRVDLTKTIRAEVPLVLVNEAKIGGEVMLSHLLTQVEVESLPTDIPDHIEVDLSKLIKAGDQVTVGDLPQVAGVQILTDAHDVIARIDSQLGAEPEEAVEGEIASPAEPEVIEKGKKEEEEF